MVMQYFEVLSNELVCTKSVFKYCVPYKNKIK